MIPVPLKTIPGSQLVLKIEQDKLPEMVYTQAPVLSPDQRFLAVQLTRRRKRNPEGKRDREYQSGTVLCVLDLQERVFWTGSTGGRNLTWMRSASGLQAQVESDD